jgi:hypothetical protein
MLGEFLSSCTTGIFSRRAQLLKVSYYFGSGVANQVMMSEDKGNYSGIEANSEYGSLTLAWSAGELYICH